jgi:hypothetical protein
MAVYVDDMNRPFTRASRPGRPMIMSHMLADTSKELHAMALRIGVPRRACQEEGTWREHYDIPLSAKRAALAAGAVQVTMREMAAMRSARREPAPDAP